jgi:hypothetical protein
MEDRQVNQVLPGGCKECEWGRCRERKVIMKPGVGGKPIIPVTQHTKAS